MSRLDHAGVNVPDATAAADFLAEAFGARVVFRIPPFSDPDGDAMRRIGAPPAASLEIVMLALGEGRLELLGWAGEGAGTAGPADSAAAGGAHLAIEVDDVSATLARVGALPGVAVLSGPLTFTDPPTAGLTNAFLRTPWGLLVELVHWG